MNTPLHALPSIRHTLASAPEGQPRFVWGATASVRLGHLPSAASGTGLGGRLDELAGRSVLVATRDQVAAALAFIALDGIAGRLIVCTPDLAAEHLPAVVANAGVNVILSGRKTELGIENLEVGIRSFQIPNSQFPIPTEWVLLTSGTTGAPKMLVHTFDSLTAPIVGGLAQGDHIVWGTFYDIRRYGGLQIFFRTILGRGSLVLSEAGETIGAHLARLGAHGVTHVSGTPSHWRRVLMSPEARAISPRCIRLSGEIADQGILNALHACYPQAQIGHAFASTEAGVGFEVTDGLEGFPASLVGAPGDVAIKVEAGSLRIRSARNALRSIGDEQSTLTDDEGFVDTGDMVERRGDRCYFLGRRSGIINVGGLKVYPEEVEAAINRHPAVRMSMVRSSRSPITGSLVAADVVLAHEPGAGDGAALKREILQVCHDRLAAYKVPATIRFVSALGIAAAGKLVRHA
jgi:acyl-coenzyme A synthetase/AMP-(fatty) acid ligase